MNYKIKVIIYLAIGFLVASFSGQVLALSFFSPKDFEDCKVEAAKEAKSQQALTILIQNCNSDFPARRKQGGGYHYYDYESGSYIDVSSPKLSKSDLRKIEGIRQQFRNESIRANQLVQEAQIKKNAKNSELLRGLSVVDWSIRCESDYLCWNKIITAKIKNSSVYELEWIQVGWVLTSGKLRCDANLSPTNAANVSIPPGQKATLSWETSDGPDSRITGCFGITSAIAK